MSEVWSRPDGIHGILNIPQRVAHLMVFQVLEQLGFLVVGNLVKARHPLVKGGCLVRVDLNGYAGHNIPLSAP